jgi:uncharacterized membrane protein YeaQ/YmgE (transglycosylase-associated protein family)
VAAGRGTAGWLRTALPAASGRVDGFNLGSIATATAGALILLWIYRQVKK